MFVCVFIDIFICSPTLSIIIYQDDVDVDDVDDDTSDEVVCISV